MLQFKRNLLSAALASAIVMAATGGALVVMVYDHSRLLAYFLGILLAAAWAAPLVAMQSLAAPPRAKIECGTSRNCR